MYADGNWCWCVIVADGDFGGRHRQADGAEPRMAHRIEAHDRRRLGEPIAFDQLVPVISRQRSATALCTAAPPEIFALGRRQCVLL